MYERVSLEEGFVNALNVTLVFLDAGLSIGMDRVGRLGYGTGMQRGYKEGRGHHLPPLTLSRGHPIDIREESLAMFCNTTLSYEKLTLL